MPQLYPEIEPYDHGMLDVGDGNRVYWEVCGNPDGKPAAERDGNLVAAYHRLLHDRDPAVRAKAAKDWCDWESALVSVDPHAKRH